MMTKQSAFLSPPGPNQPKYIKKQVLYFLKLEVALWANINSLRLHAYQLKIMNSKDLFISLLCECSDGASHPCCYCALADDFSISIRIISNDEYLPSLEDTYQQVTSTKTNFTQESSLSALNEKAIETEQAMQNQERTEQQSITNIQIRTGTRTRAKARKNIKDNVSHKRLTKKLQDCYKKVMGEKVPHAFSNLNYREDYVFMILTLLQRRGKLFEVAPYFQDAMDEFRNKIREELKNEVDRLEHLSQLIQRYLKGYNLFANGEIVESMKVVYDYDNMRQKQNFYKALSKINELRKEYGLPYYDE